MKLYIQDVLSSLYQRYPHQTLFLQAAEEVLTTLTPLLEAYPVYKENKILERIVEPERTISFRVDWVNDKGEIQTNHGFRIQFNSALGPYKGGLRFHPSVNLGVLKFLGLEQTFKNSLTQLSIGGAKGGADFDPKGKSDMEIMHFCQAFMNELYRHIGPRVDVPAGDIGVGGREIGYLYGQYKKLTAHYEGVLTGKPLLYGGSLARSEATGYGLVYFAEEMLAEKGRSLEGCTCTVSGSGNVATYCVEKLYQVGALPVTISDSRGTIYQAEGINVDVLKQVKEVERASLTRYAELCPGSTYIPVDEYPEGMNATWTVPCDVAFPCATQNEISLKAAQSLISNGCFAVAEGANMPSCLDAIHAYEAAGILFAPSKAANAGGVATSQLEMAQNAGMIHWSFDDVDAKLKEIMANIYNEASSAAAEFNAPGNLLLGANIAGFRQVADAMLTQGIC